MRKLSWLFLVLAALALVVAGIACGSNSSGDDDDDDSADDDTGDDDTGDDDTGDDDTVGATACERVCNELESCGQGGAGCLAECEGLGTDTVDCLDYGVEKSADCEQYTYYFDYCTNLDEAGTEVGDRMENVTLSDQNGNEVSLIDYVGYVVLIDVSAGWCPPCKQEALTLEDFYQEYVDQRFVILSFMVDGKTPGSKPDQAFLEYWANLYGLTFPVLGDRNAATIGDYLIVSGGQYAIPQNYVLDRGLTFTGKIEGYSESWTRSQVEDAL
jgi:peroxiredoxin